MMEKNHCIFLLAPGNTCLRRLRIRCDGFDPNDASAFFLVALLFFPFSSFSCPAMHLHLHVAMNEDLMMCHGQDGTPRRCS